MSKILKEPLLYFLLLGGVLFVLFQQVSDEGFSGGNQLEEIIISDGQVDALIVGFEKVWQRLPNQQELDGLVEEFIREEIFYREAMAMGLDKNDSIIRRRLRQKIEFLTEDIASLEVPEEEELQTFLDENTESYLTQSRFSFKQIYFNVSERGAAAVEDAQTLLTELKAGGSKDIESLGDQLMMTDVVHDDISARDVQRVLGDRFLESLRGLTPGSWQGPIESGFGLHLVYLDEKIDGIVPPLESVHDTVLRDWTSVKRQEINETFYSALRERYQVSLENSEELDSPQ